MFRIWHFAEASKPLLSGLLDQVWNTAIIILSQVMIGVEDDADLIIFDLAAFLNRMLTMLSHSVYGIASLEGVSTQSGSRSSNCSLQEQRM